MACARRLVQFVAVAAAIRVCLGRLRFRLVGHGCGFLWLIIGDPPGTRGVRAFDGLREQLQHHRACRREKRAFPFCINRGQRFVLRFRSFDLFATTFLRAGDAAAIPTPSHKDPASAQALAAPDAVSAEGLANEDAMRYGSIPSSVAAPSHPCAPASIFSDTMPDRSRICFRDPNSRGSASVSIREAITSIEADAVSCMSLVADLVCTVCFRMTTCLGDGQLYPFHYLPSFPRAT